MCNHRRSRLESMAALSVGREEKKGLANGVIPEPKSSVDLVSGVQLGGLAQASLVAALAGATYYCARQVGAELKLVVDLKPMPEAFDIDSDLAKAYWRLQQYRARNEVAYVSSLLAADAMLLIEKQLIRKAPLGWDYQIVKIKMNTALAHARALRNCGNSGVERGKLHVIVDQITLLLKTHLRRCFTLCAPAR